MGREVDGGDAHAGGGALVPVACSIVDERERLLPRLSEARAPLTRQVEVVDEYGVAKPMSIPAERDLTIYVDKRELVTLMTLGAFPEWLVLGYLCNQRLIRSATEVESITVDWEVGAAAVRTRAGIDSIEARTAHRVVTTGCGQGSVFGDLMGSLDAAVLPPGPRLRQSQLFALVNTVRLKDTIYKRAGAVHACALFDGDRLQVFIEDVGRHNAIDAIAGWLELQGPGVRQSSHKVFYTTGRLTSEMMIKAAQMGIGVVVSRSGMTEMGLDVAQRMGLCAIGRATHQHYYCFTHPDRLIRDVPLPARPGDRAA
jgi:FdhD protein